MRQRKIKVIKLLQCPQLCDSVQIGSHKWAMYTSPVCSKICTGFGADFGLWIWRLSLVFCTWNYTRALSYNMVVPPAHFCSKCLCQSTMLVHLTYHLLAHVLTVALDFSMPLVPPTGHYTHTGVSVTVHPGWHVGLCWVLLLLVPLG